MGKHFTLYRVGYFEDNGEKFYKEVFTGYIQSSWYDSAVRSDFFYPLFDRQREDGIVHAYQIVDIVECAIEDIKLDKYAPDSLLSFLQKLLVACDLYPRAEVEV